MPSVSIACQTCKNRRIKCDGTKPVCLQCIRSKRICIPHTGTKQTSFLIHDENQFASGKTKRPRGPRSSFVIRQSEIDLETKALAYYSQYHLHTVPDSLVALGGLTECVATWKTAGKVDRMVDLALASLALAVYSNVQRDPTAATEASSRYHELLQLVQERIAKVELSILTEADMDACLLAIFLMGRYETSTHQYGKPNPDNSLSFTQSWLHHEGALTILKVWHDRLSHGSASEIVKQARRGQIRSALLRSRILPEWMHDGAKFGEKGAELDYDRAITRTVLLRQSLACAQQKTNVPSAHIQELDLEAQQIEQALNAWIDQFSQALQSQCQTLTHSDPTPREHFYSNTVKGFSKLGHAGLWTQYLGASILINTTRFRILDLGSPDLLTYCTFRKGRFDCKSHIQNASDDLASLIPFCLERIRFASEDNAIVLNKDEEIMPFTAHLVVWPLTIVSCVDTIDEGKQTWFRQELAGIGALIGDGVLAVANTDEWAISI